MRMECWSNEVPKRRGGGFHNVLPVCNRQKRLSRTPASEESERFIHEYGPAGCKPAAR